MAFKPPKQQERPEFLPPFLWSLIGGDASVTDQASGLANPLGFGPVAAVRVTGPVGRRLTEYTGRDLMKFVQQTLANAPEAQELARQALKRRGLSKIATYEGTDLASATHSARRELGGAWHTIDPNDAGQARGYYSDTARAIMLALSQFDEAATRATGKVVHSPRDDVAQTLAHELTHGVRGGMRRQAKDLYRKAGALRRQGDNVGAQAVMAREQPSNQWFDAERALADWYGKTGSFNKYPAMQHGLSREEVLSESLGRALTGADYSTARGWQQAKPSVDQVLQKLLDELAPGQKIPGGWVSPW